MKKNSAQFKAMGLAAAAAGTAVLLVFKKMVKQYVETGDMIHKMALRTGFAATTLSELAYAADISGADITMLEKAVKKMAKTIVDAGYGLETYLRVFRSLGLEIEDLMAMSPEDQFLTIGAAIAEMENETLRTAAAVDVFGRSGTMLLPFFKEGAEGIAKLREEAHLLGIIFDEEAAAKAAKLKDAQTALKGSVQGLSIAILNDLIPVLTDVTKEFTAWFVDSRKDAATWTKALLTFFKSIAQGIQGMMLAFHEFQGMVFEGGELIVKAMRLQLELWMKSLGLFAKLSPVGSNIRKMYSDLADTLLALQYIEKGYHEEQEKQIDTMTNIIVGFEKFFSVLDKISEGLKTAKPAMKGLGDTIAASVLPPARQLADVFQDMVGWALPAARELPGLFENVVTDMESEIFGFEESFEDSFWKIYREAALFTSSLSSLFNQMTENQIANINKEYEARKAAIANSLMTEKSKADAMEKLDKEFEKKKKKAARAAAKRTKAIGIMESIIHTASAVAEALPNIPLAIAVGIMGAIQTALIAAQALPTLARGGRLGKGEPGIIGERGPELWVPDTAGTVVPMREGGRAGGMGANITILTEIYMQTIDGATTREFMRTQGLQAIVEAIKVGIMKPELQDALRIK